MDRLVSVVVVTWNSAPFLPRCLAGIAEQTWKEIEQIRSALTPPLLHSKGKGAEGDAPLVLVQINLS